MLKVGGTYRTWPEPAVFFFPRHRSQQWKRWPCEEEMSLPAPRASITALWSSASRRRPGRSPGAGGTGNVSESRGATVPQHPLQTFPLCSRQYVKKENKCFGSYSYVLQAPYGRHPITEKVSHCRQRHTRSRAGRHKGLPQVARTATDSSAAAAQNHPAQQVTRSRWAVCSPGCATRGRAARTSWRCAPDRRPNVP